MSTEMTRVDFGFMDAIKLPFKFNDCPICKNEVYVGRVSHDSYAVVCPKCRLSIKGDVPYKIRASRRENWPLRLMYKMWLKWQKLTSIPNTAPDYDEAKKIVTIFNFVSSQEDELDKHDKNLALRFFTAGWMWREQTGDSRR